MICEPKDMGRHIYISQVSKKKMYSCTHTSKDAKMFITKQSKMKHLCIQKYKLNLKNHVQIDNHYCPDNTDIN